MTKKDTRWLNGIYFIVRGERKQAFHEAANRDGRTMSDILNDAIDVYLGDKSDDNKEDKD